MNKKELLNAFKEEIINEEKYKEELFKLETTEKPKRIVRKLPVPLDPEEMTILLKNTKKKQHRFAFMLAFYCGLRVSEVVKLTPNDIDVKNRRILLRQSKFGKDRVVVLPKGMRDKVFKFLPLKFKNDKSGIRCLQIAFKGACRRSGLLEKKPNLKFHSLRHGFATHAINQGMPITHVRDLLGHSNISTTNIYLQANPKQAIESYEKYF